jgi:hypothetical protein
MNPNYNNNNNTKAAVDFTQPMYQDDAVLATMFRQINSKAERGLGDHQIQAMSQLVLRNPSLLKQVAKPIKTYQFCLNLIMENGMCLEFVPLELMDVDMAVFAMIQNGEAIQFVKDSIIDRVLESYHLIFPAQ